MGSGFVYFDVVGNYTNAVSDIADITFFNASQDGGLAIDDFEGGSTLIIADGPQLYSGSEENPVFAFGTYDLTEFQGSGVYTLTISAVPEPATYGMLLLGAGVVGVALRRRASKAAA